MSKSKVCPTRDRDRQRSISRPIGERRAVPNIYVSVVDRKHFGWRGTYRKAHLRNKRGYLYLCWRDETGVHSFYLGKAAKSCPTLEDPRPSAPRSPAGGSSRAKNGRK